MSATTHVQVAVRFRPINDADQDGKQDTSSWTIEFSDISPKLMTTKLRDDKHEWVFDHIFNSDSRQEDVYNTTAKRCIEDSLQGYNGTIFAYGQTGSGKTWTMFGNGDGELRGVIPRACSHIFEHISSDTETTYTIKCSFVEIYKEKIRDLLTNTKENLRIRQSVERGIYVQGVTDQFCGSQEEVLATISLGELSRATAKTKMNAKSSRSHSVFTIVIEQESPAGTARHAKLTFIDLAGSEKILKTGAEGQTLEEAKKINKSLTCLGNVIKAITENAQFVPYRDSTLTRMLEESLQGNVKTTLFITCSPSAFNAEETISSLRFGSRVKTIKTEVKANKVRSVEELEKELTETNAQLQTEKRYNARLLRLLEYLKSPQFDRANPVIPPELVAKRTTAAAAATTTSTLTRPESVPKLPTPKLPRRSETPSPSPKRKGTQEEEDTLDIIQARLELKEVEKSIRLDISQLESEAESLRSVIQELREEEGVYKRKLASSMAEKESNKQKELSDEEARKKTESALTLERQELRSKIAEMENRATSLAEKISEIQLRANESDENLLALQGENERFGEELSKIATLNEEQIQIVSSLEQEIFQCTQSEKECTEEAKNLRRELDSACNTKDENQDTKSLVCINFDCLQSSQLQKKLSKKQQQKEKLASLESENSQKQKELAKLQDQLKAIREAWRKAMSSSNSTLTSLQKNLIEALKLETSLFIALHDRKLADENGVTVLQAFLNQDPGKAERTENEDRDALLAGLSEELEAQESSADISEETCHQLQLDSAETSATILGNALTDALSAKLERLQLEITESETQTTDAMERNVNTTNELERLKAELVTKEQKAKAAHEESHSLRIKLQNQKQTCNIVCAESEKQSKELASITTTNRETTQRTEELRKKLAELQDLERAMRSEITELAERTTQNSLSLEAIQRSLDTETSIVKRLESGRRIWVPPSRSATLVDAFKERVNLKEKVTALRPTLSGSFILEAARAEHEKSMTNRGIVPKLRSIDQQQSQQQLSLNSTAQSPESTPPSSPKTARAIQRLLTGEDHLSIDNKKLTQADIKLYERLFKMADKDNNGTIDAEELLWLMRTLGKNVSIEEINALVTDLDLDGNGCIDFMELLRGMDRLNEFFEHQVPLSSSTTASPSTSPNSSPSLQSSPPPPPPPS